LPSVVDTDLPLTTNMKVGPKEEDASMPVAGSKYYVKRRFRHAWVHLGGQASFGLPISEAFAIARPKPHDAHVIQYFEAAALELYQTTLQVPFDELKPDEKAMLQARPLDLGVAYTAAKGIPTGGDKRIASAFQAFYDQHRGAWRLGKPITDAFVEDLGGVSTTVQYFEKGRLQRNPTTNVVEFGQLGRWAWETQCASAPVQ
jgi:hypothetical protein